MKKAEPSAMLSAFEQAILALVPLPPEMLRIFDIAQKHYGKPYPNKGHRAAVSRAIWALWRLGKVTHMPEEDLLTGRHVRTYFQRRPES